MARYLIDTSVLIDFSKGHEPVRRRLLGMIRAEHDMGICAVQLAEFYAGLSAAEYPVWDTFFAELAYWHIGPVSATQAGKYQYLYARRGQAIATADALTAAVASQEGATILTNNIKHFPMPDIQVQSLRD